MDRCVPVGVILMTMRMCVRVPMMVIMMVVVVMSGMPASMEQPCACQIDEQAQNGHGDGLIELDRDGRGQADHGLEPDRQGDDGQDDSARISGQLADFSGAEGEALVMGMAACVRIDRKSTRLNSRH